MTTTITASVVLTDLVGSAEVAGLDPAATAELRSIHLRVLRDAVAATGGRELKDLGGGLMVVYSSLGRALDGAVCMQQGVEQHNRKATVPLGVRIGLSSGDATEEDGDLFGDPVLEAARLCATADGGQILTTEMVQLLARRTNHRFNALGAVELSGRGEPIDVCEVAWDPAKVAAAVPMPVRLEVTPATGVVGRRLEGDQLLALQKVAFAGDGHRLVLISGDAGIGKTTLAGDLARRAHDDGATVLYGRCDEDLGVPYQPFVEALTDLMVSAPDDVLQALDERHLSELRRLVPRVHQRIPTLADPSSTDADAQRYLLFGAVTAVLAALAHTAPVVLVLDDLHWADKPTVLLLQHLAATLDRAEVLAIGTYRDSDLTATHPLTEALVALRQQPAVQRLAVGGLDDGGVVALLEGLAGHEMGSDGIELAHAVRRETGGNPFFTAEVLRHLAETDAIRQEGGRWVAAVELSAIGLPESVREVVGQRVRRLGESVRQILTLASVIGRNFELPLLARLADRDEDDVRQALDEATQAAIVAAVDGRPERFTFSHALVQHTLYDDLSASRRVRTHRRIGELLETECGDDPGERVGELAHHWIAATRPADAAKAAHYALAAGARALAALAPDEAIRWFRQAVELLDADPHGAPLERLDARIGLGDAQRQAGDPGYRETLLDAAAEAARRNDTDRLVAAALANQRGTVSSVGTIDAERIAMLERALSAVDGRDSQAGALLLASLAAELTFSGDIARIRVIADSAESMARRLGDDATVLRVLNLTFLARWVPDGLERNAAASHEALLLADQVGDPFARFWAALNRVYAMASGVDRRELDAAMDLAELVAREIGQPYPTWSVLYMRCMQVLLNGDADEADRLANDALQISSDSGQPDAFVVYGANLAGIRFHQGRLAEILPLIEQVAADNPGLPGFQAAHAMMLCECGQFDDARPLLDAARLADFHRSSYDYVWLTTTTLWAETAAWLDDAPAAAVLHERLTPFEAQGVVSGVTFSGTVGMYLGRLAAVLGRHEDAIGCFERADAQLDALRAPYHRARNQVEWARQLILHGDDADRRRASELLTDARAAAHAHGCRSVERRADDLLRPLP